MPVIDLFFISREQSFRAFNPPNVFTTFSTFSVEGLTYLKNGDLLIFITYLLFSIIGSILLAALGYYIYQLGNS